MGCWLQHGTPQLSFPAYHLGPGVNFTVGQVAAAVRKAVPGAVLELGPGPSHGRASRPSADRLTGDRFLADTGYAPTHSLEAAIGAYADWMRANPNAWRALCHPGLSAAQSRTRAAETSATGAGLPDLSLREIPG